MDSKEFSFQPSVRHEVIKPVQIFVDKEVKIEVMNANVFKEWKTDNPETYRTMLESDFKFWKVARFVKDPEDLTNIEQLIEDNLP